MPNAEQPLYDKEKPQPLSLSPEQREAVQSITTSIKEVDEEVREKAVEDVIATLENGHPLNRLVTNRREEVIGYIACEDFVEDEVYVKYFGTTRNTGRSLLREILPFIRLVKELGYQKITFHGWNERLNRILERYDFQPVRSDDYQGQQIDFYEKNLQKEQPTSEEKKEQRRRAREEKYLLRMGRLYEKVLDTFPEKDRSGMEFTISHLFTSLDTRLSFYAHQQRDQDEPFVYTIRQEMILQLKIARHLQKHPDQLLDLNTLFDAIIETPNFINTDRGSLHRLLEVHEIKTMEKIAAKRQERAESASPVEVLLTTESGRYQLARLLTMEHLEEESEFMKNCVGTSDSYFNRMKRGEIEILSLRSSQTGDPELTIEYNLKTKIIEQMKKYDDAFLSPTERLTTAVIDALRKLKTTTTDKGEPRDFVKIADSELLLFKVKPYHLITDKGEVHFRDYDPEDSDFILKRGEMKFKDNMSKEDIAKIIQIVTGNAVQPEQIARSIEELTNTTTTYIGKLSKELVQQLPNLQLERIYTDSSENEIIIETSTIGGMNKEELKRALVEQDVNVFQSPFVKEMIEDNDFYILPNQETVTSIILRVKDLGFFRKSPTTDELYQKAQEWGLELHHPEQGPRDFLRKANNFTKSEYSVAMKPIINSGGHPRVFVIDLGWNGHQGLITSDSANSDDFWWLEGNFSFRLPKPD